MQKESQTAKTTCLLIAAPNPLSGVGGGPKVKVLGGVAKVWLVTSSKLVVSPTPYTVSSGSEIEETADSIDDGEL
jgi:hypothetical protein